MHVKEYLEKIKGLSAKKKTQYLAIVLIIAVILLIYFSTLVPSENGENEAEPPGQSSAAFGQSAEDLEQKLSAALSKVDGAGAVDVVINYESTSELVPATSEDIQCSSSSEEERYSESRTEK